MKLKTISSGSIDDLLEFPEYEVNSKKIEKENLHVGRKKFLKLLGMGVMGASLSVIPNLLFTEKAHGQCYDYYEYQYCDP